jgi:Peroxin-3
MNLQGFHGETSLQGTPGTGRLNHPNCVTRHADCLILQSTMPLSSLLPSRKTLVTTGGFFGGMYMAQNFMKDRLEEAKEKLEEDRLAKEK